MVDVGGSRGALLASILAAHPDMRGVLCDLPEVVNGAPPLFVAAGVMDRCEIVGVDFFESLPPGGDAYVLKHILHDWDDEHAVVGRPRRCQAALQRICGYGTGRAAAGGGHPHRGPSRA
ncbi:MAG: hypothetical protein M3069_04305 [Chloroflexota bacterium]|nr:hypothetical protein [Chloroflexota bacterium]